MRQSESENRKNDTQNRFGCSILQFLDHDRRIVEKRNKNFADSFAFLVPARVRFFMTLPATTFVELLAQVRLGDEEATRLLIAEYEPEVRLVAKLRLGAALRPYLDSIDLVQSVHRSLLIGLREEKFSISTPQNLIALALTIVRRKVASQWRKVQRQQRLSGISGTAEELPEVLVGLMGREADPAAMAALKDQIRRLWSEMDPVERQLVELRMEGSNTAEVARQLNLDADVLRVRFGRLRQRLRELGLDTEWL